MFLQRLYAVYLLIFLTSVASQTNDFKLQIENVSISKMESKGLNESEKKLKTINNTAEDVLDTDNHHTFQFATIDNETSEYSDDKMNSSMKVEFFNMTDFPIIHTDNNHTIQFATIDNETSEYSDEKMNSSMKVEFFNITDFPIIPLEPVHVKWDELPTIEVLFGGAGFYRTHAWDKAVYTPVEYHLSLCGRMCVGEEIIHETHLRCPTIECFECICDRPRCEIYDICCPEVSSTSDFPHSFKEDKEKMASDTNGEDMQDFQSFDDTQINEKLQDQESKDGKMAIDHDKNYTVKCEDKNYLYIQSCPLHFEDSLTRKLCEEDFAPGGDITEDIFARATDNSTGAIYHNVYCAVCNEVIEVSTS